MRKTGRSRRLYEQSCRLMPGGVNSPVRAFGAVGSAPPFIKRGKGSKIFDVDGNGYIDYVMSWGPLILGHAHPDVVRAVAGSCENGTSFGAPTELELTLAGLIRGMFPSMKMLRMVNSGTEATMSAARAARAFTQKKKIIKFDGCYHGHADGFLVKAGSGLATLSFPNSQGVPAEYAGLTLVAEYNNAAEVEAMMRLNQGEVAAVIVEPVAGNMGVVAPREGFLRRLRELCTEHDVLLIFDEVITGFRVAPGGAQELYGVQPDLTCLGKIIGGGAPVGAYGGRRAIMKMIAPLGAVYQAGTLSGNPLAMSAGIATLTALKRDKGLYERLERLSAMLETGLLQAAREEGVPLVINRVGSMLSLFFTRGEVANLKDARRSDPVRFASFFRAMLDEGIYLAPSAHEAWFLSAAHSLGDIQRTISAAQKAFRRLGRSAIPAALQRNPKHQIPNSK